MTELERLLRQEIAERRPLRFDRFMELALYHPHLGYYCRSRDPFGIGGDYFTNAQIQPVFGRLIARQIQAWEQKLGCPGDFTAAELGSGRGETAREVRKLLPHIRYVEVERDSGELPERFTGVVFSNEFFDALPVRLARFSAGRWRERFVGLEGDALTWVDSDRCEAPLEDYLLQFVHEPEEDQIAETNLEALAWIERIAHSLERGYVLTIDYGYTMREMCRFPQGTLMTYRRHAALPDVLGDPGERDITAHVSFTALAERGREVGLDARPLMTQAQFLLSVGQSDEFRSVVVTESDRMQLKTLLVGMGETYSVLVQEKRLAP